MLECRHLAFAKVEHPRGQRNAVICRRLWSKSRHGFFEPHIWVLIPAQQGPASRSDVVACTAFQGLGVGFDGGIGFSLRSVHVTHQHPTFRALVIDADAVLRCAERVIFQVQAMHGGRCRDPRLDVFRTVRSESVSEQTDGGFRMTSVEFSLRLVDEFFQRGLIGFRFCDDG